MKQHLLTSISSYRLFGVIFNIQASFASIKSTVSQIGIVLLSLHYLTFVRNENCEQFNWIYSELLERGRQITWTSSTCNLISVKRWSANFYSTINGSIKTTPKSLIINDINYSISQSIKRKNGCCKY